jgi:DNA-binding transcriptional LysR family regulator
MNPDLDLRELRAFTILAKLGSYTATAREMSVTQSAVSHSMKRLQERVGCALIYNKGKTAHLTPEGRRFLNEVGKCLDGLQSAMAQIEPRQQDLNAVIGESLALAILAPVLREYQESCPRSSVRIRTALAPEVNSLIESGEVDVGLTVQSPNISAMENIPVLADQLMFVCAPGSEPAKQGRIVAKDLARWHFILPPAGGVTFGLISDYFLKTGARPKSYVEIPSHELLKGLVKLDLGYAFLPEWSIARELREGSLISLPLPKSSIRRRWVLAHQASRKLRPNEQTFLGLCRMACRTLQQPGG